MHRPSHDKIKDHIKDYIKVRASKRPVLVGELCLYLGWWATTKETESILEEMVHDGSLRQITETEKVTFDIRHGYLPAV